MPKRPMVRKSRKRIINFVDMGFGQRAERLTHLVNTGKKRVRKKPRKIIGIEKHTWLGKEVRALSHEPNVKLRMGIGAVRQLKRMRDRSVKVINGDFFPATGNRMQFVRVF